MALWDLGFVAIHSKAIASKPQFSILNLLPPPYTPLVETMPASPSAPRLLIVDDDPAQRSLLDSFLTSQGFQTVVVSSGEKALEALRQQKIDMMISDVRMPGLTGLDTLRMARKEHGSFPILLVTGYADVRDAVGAIRDGAVNYLSKPIDLDELLASVRQATGLSTNAPLKFDAGKQLPANIVAVSPISQALFRDVSLIAASESRVLITGESGVGKEVIADVIHAWSPRASGPLIKVNCAAIPETLLESELFGHEKGSFTGASAQRIGRLKAARWRDDFSRRDWRDGPATPGQAPPCRSGRPFPAHRL